MISDLKYTFRNHQQSYNFGCSLEKRNGTVGLNKTKMSLLKYADSINIKNYTHMYLYCITVYVEDYLKKIKITKAQSIA